jgi:hypothetical protein
MVDDDLSRPPCDPLLCFSAFCVSCAAPCFCGVLALNAQSRVAAAYDIETDGTAARGIDGCAASGTFNCCVAACPLLLPGAPCCILHRSLQTIRIMRAANKPTIYSDKSNGGSDGGVSGISGGAGDAKPPLECAAPEPESARSTARESTLASVLSSLTPVRSAKPVLQSSAAKGGAVTPARGPRPGVFATATVVPLAQTPKIQAKNCAQHGAALTPSLQPEYAAGVGLFVPSRFASGLAPSGAVQALHVGSRKDTAAETDVALHFPDQPLPNSDAAGASAFSTMEAPQSEDSLSAHHESDGRWKGSSGSESASEQPAPLSSSKKRRGAAGMSALEASMQAAVQQTEDSLVQEEMHVQQRVVRESRRWTGHKAPTLITALAAAGVPPAAALALAAPSSSSSSSGSGISTSLSTSGAFQVRGTNAITVPVTGTGAHQKQQQSRPPQAFRLAATQHTLDSEEGHCGGSHSPQLAVPAAHGDVAPSSSDSEDSEDRRRRMPPPRTLNWAGTLPIAAARPPAAGMLGQQRVGRGGIGATIRRGGPLSSLLPAAADGGTFQSQSRSYIEPTAPYDGGAYVVAQGGHAVAIPVDTGIALDSLLFTLDGGDSKDSHQADSRSKTGVLLLDAPSQQRMSDQPARLTRPPHPSSAPSTHPAGPRPPLPAGTAEGGVTSDRAQQSLGRTGGCCAGECMAVPA